MKGLLLVLALLTGLPAYAAGQQGATGAPAQTEIAQAKPDGAKPDETSPGQAPGQAQAQTKPEENLPPVTRECQVGGAEVVAQSPLPNVVKAWRERQKIKILTIGASVSARRDTGAGGYYDLVEQLLEQTYKGLQVEIVQRGVPGELARDAGSRIKMEVALVDPDLVLWQVGTADALARLPIEEFEASLTKTVTWLKEHDVDVALIGLHYVKALTNDAHYQAIRKSLKKVGTDLGVMRVGRYEAIETLARLRGEQGTPGAGARLSETAQECSAEYLARAIAIGLFHKDKKVLPGEKPAGK